MREMVRATSAADINSRPVAASPAAPMRDLDLLLRLSGRIVKGCRLPGSVAFAATVAKTTGVHIEGAWCQNSGFGSGPVVAAADLRYSSAIYWLLSSSPSALGAARHRAGPAAAATRNRPSGTSAGHRMRWRVASTRSSPPRLVRRPG